MRVVGFFRVNTELGFGLPDTVLFVLGICVLKYKSKYIYIYE